jgi:hypothetical protein
MAPEPFTCTEQTDQMTKFTAYIHSQYSTTNQNHRVATPQPISCERRPIKFSCSSAVNIIALLIVCLHCASRLCLLLTHRICSAHRLMLWLHHVGWVRDMLACVVCGWSVVWRAMGGTVGLGFGTNLTGPRSIVPT